MMQRRFDAGQLPTVNISSLIKEMGLLRGENPQLPRGFAYRARTPETGENGKIGL
jgi:hypothetical protein